MSLFYESLDKQTAFNFKARKKAFKKNKPCAICGRKLSSDKMMVAHINPVRKLSDFDALYDISNWEVRCLDCERRKNIEEKNMERKNAVDSDWWRMVYKDGGR